MPLMLLEENPLQSNAHYSSYLPCALCYHRCTFPQPLIHTDLSCFATDSDGTIKSLQMLLVMQSLGQSLASLAFKLSQFSGVAYPFYFAFWAVECSYIRKFVLCGTGSTLSWIIVCVNSTVMDFSFVFLNQIVRELESLSKILK